MAKINCGETNILRTHEGAPAKRISPLRELKRTVLACLLWEDTFYEDGEDVATRIATLVKKNEPKDVSDLAIHARKTGKLRHVPLLLARELARVAKGRIVGDTIYNVIQRADELTEFLAIYWKDNKDQPLSAQVKQGLARAFRKFDAYALGKYNQDGPVKLRDVLFLSHAKPKNDEQAAIWKKLIDGTLPTPDTWEVALSAGADKKETFERLLKEGKLGYLALLRNLRNMEQAGVNHQLVEQALLNGDASRVLPFRFLAAARHAPQYEATLDKMMIAALDKINIARFSGTTGLYIDVSGSMTGKVSRKSDLSRLDAAKALAILLRGIADCRVFAFNTGVWEIPSRQGMALADAIGEASGGTAVDVVVDHGNKLSFDRIIVITDEQSHDQVASPVKRGYMINVATFQNGVGYGKWLHLDGFSESIVNYIRGYELMIEE
ncbi:MAG: TROVE domain-containing protein [Nitrososphaera sp.]